MTPGPLTEPDVSTLAAGGVARLLTPPEVADLLGVSEAWLRRQAAGRLIPCTRLGRQLRFTPGQVDAIVQTAAQNAVAERVYGLTRRSRRAS